MGASREVVDRAYAAFGRGDIPAIIELLYDDVEWSSPGTLPQGGGFRGKDGVLEFFQGVGAAWDSLEIETENVDELGDGRVVGVVRGSGALRGGGPAEYGAVHLFTVQGGKITRFRELVDVDQALAQ